MAGRLLDENTAKKKKKINYVVAEMIGTPQVI